MKYVKALMLGVCLLIGSVWASEEVFDLKLKAAEERIKGYQVEQKYQSLSITTSIVFALIGIAFSAAGIYGFRSINQLKGEFHDELETIRKEKEKIENIRKELQAVKDNTLTVDDIASDYEEQEEILDELAQQNIRSEQEVFEEKLFVFLNDYKKWNFSPSRIKNWGGSKNRFQLFSLNPNDA